MGFGGSSKPAPPPPPPPPPVAPPPAVKPAEPERSEAKPKKARKTSAGGAISGTGYGASRRGSVASSSQGVLGQAPTQKKTLLGQ